MRKRDIGWMLWLDDNEKKRLKSNAEKAGLSQSSYVRSLINGYKPKEQPTQEIYEMLFQLRGIATNLNQIAKRANVLDYIDAPFYKKTYEKDSILIADNIFKDCELLERRYVIKKRNRICVKNEIIFI